MTIRPMPKQDSGAVEAAWRAAARALLALALISASAPMFGVGPVTAADLAADPPEMQDKNLPEYTLVQEPEPSPTPSPVVGLTMRATHYGESYNGGPLGCGSRV